MSKATLRMDETQALGCLEFLRTLHPPQKVVDVGVGQGMGLMHLWRDWDVEKALLIDLSETPPRWIENAVLDHPDWNYLPALVADDSQEMPCFVASNPSESGLIDPSRLTPYWPHLRCLEEKTLWAETLDELTGDHEPNWLVVDCLSALRVIQGATETLQSSSVILARVALDESEGEQEVTSLKVLSDYLETLHFSPLLIWEENQPQLGSVVFVRDWEQPFKETQKASQLLLAQVADQQKSWESKLAKQKEESLALSSAKDQLLVENDAIRSQKDHAESGLRELEATLAREVDKSAAKEAEIARLTQERETLNQEKGQLTESLASERHAKEEALANCAKEATAKGDAHLQITALEHEKSELTAQRDALIQEKAGFVAYKDAQLAALNAEKSGLIEIRDALTQEKAAVEAAKNAEIQALSNEKKDLTASKDQHAALAAERQNQIESLTQTLEAERKEKEGLTAQRNAEAKAMAEAKERITILEQDKRALTQSYEALANEKNLLAEKKDAEVAALTQERDQLQTELSGREQELADLTQTLKAETKAKTEAQTLLAAREKESLNIFSSKNTEIYELTEKMNVIITSRDDLMRERRELKAAIEQQFRVAEDCHNQIKQLTHAHEEALASLNQTEARVKTQYSDLSHLQKQISTLSKENMALKALLESRDSELAQYLHRQSIINDEMLKAEAQLDLIKDVLLREKEI